MHVGTPRTPIRVFLSYSRTDSAKVDYVEAELISYGFHTWVDREHIEGGQRWTAQIEAAIQESDAVVVGISPDAVQSTWVTNELLYAQQLNKPIIPIVLRSVQVIPLLLVALQYIDFQPDESQALQQLRLRLLELEERSRHAALSAEVAVPGAADSQQSALTTQQESSTDITRLVALPAPAPAKDLNDLFVEGISAWAHGQLDIAEASLRQVVERDAQFGGGLAAQQLAEARRQLIPFQLQRLRSQAEEAEKRGAWGEAIGAWQAILERTPDNAEAHDRLERNEQNKAASWLYTNARSLAQAQDWIAFQQMWRLLMEQAPDYGDPGEVLSTVPRITFRQISSADGTMESTHLSLRSKGAVWSWAITNSGGKKLDYHSQVDSMGRISARTSRGFQTLPVRNSDLQGGDSSERSQTPVEETAQISGYLGQAKQVIEKRTPATYVKLHTEPTFEIHSALLRFVFA
ncbi:MAG TPA: TIR domain-containing protein [Ktedonobacterales bacterium]|nr:TIR domain-containing protein [Ktedonobacterales bacterium]